jgi:NADH-quinone oxidoreductase subunit N
MFLYGFLYELGVTPLHVWLPDVYTRSDKVSIAYLASFLKLFAVYALCRLLYNIDLTSVALIVAVISAITMTLGNICALTAEREEQILAFSTIAQSGYALIALATFSDYSKIECIPVFIYQILATAIAKYVLFTVHLVRHSRIVDFVVVTSVLSLIGIPPLIGFWPKLMLFLLALKYGYPWLAGLLVVNTALSVPYYIRLFRMYRLHASDMLDRPYSKICLAQAVVGALLIIVCGVVLSTDMLRYILETCLEVSLTEV